MPHPTHNPEGFTALCSCGLCGAGGLACLFGAGAVVGVALFVAGVAVLLRP